MSFKYLGLGALPLASWDGWLGKTNQQNT